MIMQLLRISTKPIKYELEIERARLEYNQDFLPKAKVKTTPPELEVKTKNAQVLLDTYQARRSLGQNNTMDWSKMHADRGRESISRTTREYVDIGNAMSRIDQGVTIAQIFAERVLGEQPVLFTAFLPSTGAEISWIPFDISSTYHDGGVKYDWQIMRNIMNYVPGSVRMTILQLPRVEIEYLGGQMYFPPSADPDYIAIDD